MTQTLSSTPTIRQTARRGVFWVVLGIVAVAFVIVVTLLRGGGEVGGPPLAADNAGIAGAQATAEVLRQQGIRVEIAGTLAAARAAAGSGRDVTLFFSDPSGYLTGDRLGDITGIGADTVIADPDFPLLAAVAPGVGSGGAPDGDTAEASCSVPAAERAGEITVGDRSFGEADGWTGCFPTGSGTVSLLQRDTAGGTTTLLADASFLRNDTVTSNGDAALAIGLLGGNSTLVWYQPTLGDIVGERAPTLGELTPDWVTPVILLLVVVTAAAAVWRGRRFGALVIEDLPVTVHAGETREGRARLYARTASRGRAADSLRIGAVGRLAGHLGLASTATVDEVCGAAAAATGLRLDEVRDVLLEAVPRTDRELVALSSRLDAIETAVARATTVGDPHHQPPNESRDS